MTIELDRFSLVEDFWFETIEEAEMDKLLEAAKRDSVHVLDRYLEGVAVSFCGLGVIPANQDHGMTTMPWLHGTCERCLTAYEHRLEAVTERR